MGRGRAGARPKIWGLIALHDDHPGPFEASLIRAGVRWRDAGSEEFTWGDCIALVENVPFDDPLFRAMKPEEWIWYDPSRDPLITVVDLLMQINAKTPVQDRKMRDKLPKPTPRPWSDKGKGQKSPSVQGKSWDEMTDWLASRVAH